MVRNIVFDMGMVLMGYHPLDACRNVVPDEIGAQSLCDALFFHPDWVRLDEGSISEEDLARNAKARLADARLRPLIDRLLAAMPENILSPIPGMVEIEADLLSQGYRLYLLSNASLAVSRRRDVIPGLERFCGVLFSADEKLMKPDSALYRRLTERYGLNPSECLFIDDNEDNVESARRLGWTGYRFTGDPAALRGFLAGLNAAPTPETAST
jgi:putative hydrolase of the HAD superfamily